MMLLRIFSRADLIPTRQDVQVDDGGDMEIDAAMAAAVDGAPETRCKRVQSKAGKDR